MSIWGSKQFYASSDIDLDVKIYVGTLQFRTVDNLSFSSSSTSSTSSLFDEAYIALQLIDGGIPLHPFARSTRLGVCDTSTSLNNTRNVDPSSVTVPSPSSSTSLSSTTTTPTNVARTRLLWNEWITLPIKIKELPPTAQLVVRLWTIHNQCIGGGTLKLFTPNYTYQKGYVPLTLWYTGLKEENIPIIHSGTTNTTNGYSLPTPLALLLRSDNQLTTYIKALERYSSGSNGSNSGNENNNSLTVNGAPKLTTMTPTLFGGGGNQNTASPWIDRLIFQQLQKEFQYYYFQNDQATLLHHRYSPAVSTPTSSSSSSSPVPSPPSKKDTESSSDVWLPPSIVDTLILGYGTLFFPLFTYPILYEDTRYDGYDENITLNNSTSKKMNKTLTNATGTNASSASNNSSSSGSLSSSNGSQQNHQLLTPPLTVTPSTTVMNAMNAVPLLPSSSSSSSSTADTSPSLSTTDPSLDPSQLALTALGRTYWSEQLSVVYDPEEGGDLGNPTDNKYHKLARGGLNSYSNPYLKPNRVELTKLQTITNTPQDSYSILGMGKVLNPEARDLIWKFRYTLTTNKKGALPFILAIDWDDEEEIKEASLLLQKWVLIDIEDALRLLCPQFTSAIVRKFAVNALKAVNDNDLGLFLLQLVQALRYEPSLSSSSSPPGTLTTNDGATPSTTITNTPQVNGTIMDPAVPASTIYRLSPLADFLLERCSNNLELGMAFHWYLRVGIQDARAGALFMQVHEAFLQSLPSTAMGQLVEDTIRKHEHFITRINSAILEVMQPKREKVEVKIERLNKLLSIGSPYDDVIECDPPIMLPLNPLIYISGIQVRNAHMFKSALYPTAITLRIHPESRINWLVPNEICGVTIHETALKAAKEALQYTTSRNVSHPQHHPHSATSAIVTVNDTSTGTNNNNSNNNNLPTKSPSRGNSLSTLTTTGTANGTENGTLPIVTGSAVAVSGTDTVSSKTLSSSTQSIAAVITEAVKTAMPNGIAPATYKIIFKNGDDMRQDQLIIQMIRLLDAQLKRVGLDLCLSPYAVLATSMSSGIMEMVLNSSPVSAVVEKYRNNPIQSFFRESYPSSTNEFGIQSEIMDTYIKSCAGYCVITYLLGIGDRHLDNIMLTRDGHLFHIDFGYIFGKDPKPLPPPMRITKEMIDGMGGPDNPNYQRFRSYCCQAYNILRRSATLITVLLSLMRDAGIDDLHPEPMTTIAKLYEKFRVDIDDETADSVFLRLVDDSVAAMFPAFFEFLHKIRVAMR